MLTGLDSNDYTQPHNTPRTHTGMEHWRHSGLQTANILNAPTTLHTPICSFNKKNQSTKVISYSSN